MNAYGLTDLNPADEKINLSPGEVSTTEARRSWTPCLRGLRRSGW